MLIVLLMGCFGAAFFAMVMFLIYQDSQSKKKPSAPAPGPGPSPVTDTTGDTGTPTGNGGGLGGDTGGQTGSFGKMPSWAQKGSTSPAAEQSYAENKQTITQFNNSGKQIDFLLYGDSITRGLAYDKRVWNKYFGGWAAAPMGVGGNVIEQLGWRIMSGNERPAKPPKCIALLIGVNNSPVNFQQAAGRLEELLRWLQRAYPSTKLILMALLPATRGHNNPKTANPILRQVANRLNITFAECGQSMNPMDTRLYKDQLHPTSGGYEVVLPCLKKAVESLVK